MVLSTGKAFCNFISAVSFYILYTDVVWVGLSIIEGLSIADTLGTTTACLEYEGVRMNVHAVVESSSFDKIVQES